jgi:imidazolonepropionase-like amidohydrolase
MTKRFSFLFAMLAAAAWAGADDSFAIRNATVHPVSAPEIQNGTVIVQDGKIVGVGRNLTPPKGIKVIDAKGMHVYPGMINSATDLGLQEISAIRETVDTGELGQFDPQLKAEVAVNPASEHIPVTRANGITTAISLPFGDSRRGGSSASVISGQAALMHLDGWTWEEMAVKGSAAMSLRFPALQTSGSLFSATLNAEGGVSGEPGRSSMAEARRLHDKAVRDLEQFFEMSRRYQVARKAGGSTFVPDLRYEAMLPVLEGKMPVLVMASRARTIHEAIQFADKQHIRMILADPVEVKKIAPELKAKNIPVILGASLALPRNEDDPYDSIFTLAKELYDAGVKFAFGSFDNQFARNVPYQAANAVAFGLPAEEALRSVTLNAAQIWGVDDKIGSIAEGKWADLILTDGDPLEARTTVKQVFIKGKPVDLENKHHRLYEKYLGRP